MPLSHKEVSDLVAGATTEAAALVEYRNATQPTVVRLSDDMASLLGATNGYRRLTPFLDSVVSAISSKIEVDDTKLRASKVRETKQIASWLGDTKWSLIERDLYYATCRDGTAYVLVRWTENGPDFSVRELFDGTTGAGSVYENGELKFTFNGWKQGAFYYLDCYFEDKIEKYRREAEKEWEPRRDEDGEEWPLPWVDDTGAPLGVALVEFSIGGSDIDSSVQLARDLNEAELDMIATSRTQGWKQRYLKGQKNPNILLNESGQPLISPYTGKPFPRTISTSPGSVLLIGENAEFGQLDASPPDSTAIDKILELLSLVSTVPNHYFSGQWPSGVALIQSESRLNHKVEGHQGRLSGSIAAMLRLTMRLSNHFASTTFNAEQPLDIPWHSPQIETEDLKREREKATAENVEKYFTAKLMSRYTAVKTIHPEWSEEDIAAELERLEADTPAPVVPVLTTPGVTQDGATPTPDQG